MWNAWGKLMELINVHETMECFDYSRFASGEHFMEKRSADLEAGTSCANTKCLLIKLSKHSNALFCFAFCLKKKKYASLACLLPTLT